MVVVVVVVAVLLLLVLVLVLVVLVVLVVVWGLIPFRWRHALPCLLFYERTCSSDGCHCS